MFFQSLLSKSSVDYKTYSRIIVLQNGQQYTLNIMFSRFMQTIDDNT